MARIRLTAVSLCVAACALPACWTTPISLAPSLAPLEPGRYTIEDSERVHGTAWSMQILGYPFGFDDQIGTALADAQDRYREKRNIEFENLIHVAVEFQQVYFFVGSYYRTHVYGIPVRSFESIRQGLESSQ